MRKKDTMKHEETMLTTGYDPQKSIDDYSAPVPRYIDSDESDSDEMLPLVERSHGILRSAKDIDSDRLYNSGDKLDHSGMRCKQLDYIDWNDNRYDLNRLEPERFAAKVNMCHTINSCTRSETLPSNRKEATQIEVRLRCTKAVVSGHVPESCSRRNRKLFQQKWPRRPARRALRIYRTFRTTGITSSRSVRR